MRMLGGGGMVMKLLNITFNNHSRVSAMRIGFGNLSIWQISRFGIGQMDWYREAYFLDISSREITPVNITPHVG